MPPTARTMFVLTGDPAHVGLPETRNVHRTKTQSTSACASRNEDMRMPKQHSKSSKHRPVRVVAVSASDAVLQGGRDERLEVDRLLRTCAQGGQKGLGGMLGTHGDVLVMLGLALHADLESW